MSRSWGRRLVGALIVVIALLLGANVKEQFGISFSLDEIDALRVWVEELGWWGPAAFVLLMICRLFIGLSSHLVLILGGLVFGVAGGIVWGSVGLVASSLALYVLAALLGADWVERRFGSRYAALLARVQRLGAVAIFAITAHPFGLLTPAHLAAGLVGLGAGRFTLAVSLAAPLRAAPFVVLGTALLDLTARQSVLITAAMVVVFVLPLAHPRVRTWVRGDPGDASGASSSGATQGAKNSEA